MVSFLIYSLLAVSFQISSGFIRGQPPACPSGQRIVYGNSGFYCCHLIPFCDDSSYFCPAPGNHYCTKCIHNVKDKIAYRLSNDRKTCEKLCSWRPESTCFPGKCSDGTKHSCECATGFTNPDQNCQEILPDKHITKCVVKLIRLDERSGQEVESQIVHCDLGNKLKKVPITMHVHLINLQLEAEFDIDLKSLELPYYINKYDVGILSADLQVQLFKIAGSGQTGKTVCKHFNKPENELSCETQYDGIRKREKLQHGERILITPIVTLGGVIEVKDFENYPHYRDDHLPHSQATAPIELLYDFYPPKHCSLDDPSCFEPLVNVGEAGTRNKKIDITFPGWFDDSGIQEYEYEVYKMQPYGDQLGYADKDILTKGIVLADSGKQSATITFRNPGVYCVQVMVKAYDGRYTRARKFLIFDDKSRLTINSNGQITVLNSIATKDPTTFWQTDKTTVTLNVHGKFRNQEHVINKFFSPIRESSLEITPGYEERTGQPPYTRSMEAVHNVDGIHEFQAGYKKVIGDTELYGPSNWINMGSREVFTLPIEAVDGDTIKVWVRAVDVIGFMIEDSILIHIDSTGPIVDSFTLKRNYETYYGIHQSEELHGLTFEFQAFDPESGLTSLSWELIDVFTEQRRLGGGTLPIKKESRNKCDIYICTCVDAIDECYQIYNQVTLDSDKLAKHQGRHDFDYRITVTAKNHAGVETVQSFKFTIDITAPEPGTVLDALPGGSDIDYQQGLTLHGSWDGFFDRESSIAYYKYTVLNKCADKSILLGRSEPKIVLQRTSLRYASVVVTEPGKYYFNVMGYNKGDNPSETACSDGVVIDETPPKIRDIVIKRSLVKPGLVQSADGNVWLIDEHRFKTAIPKPPKGCRSHMLKVEDIDSFPDGEEHNITEEKCLLVGAATPNIYLSSNHELVLSWVGEDLESGIYDYEIGLSSTPDALVPELQEYASTSSHGVFIGHHLDLRGGQKFYVFIKAINRAQMITTKVIGPIIVDITPPVIMPNIRMSVKYKEYHRAGYILVYWNTEFIVDPESGEHFHFEFSIGTTATGAVSDIQSFTPVDQSLDKVCRKKHLPSCFAIAIKDLDWKLHDHQQYDVIIRAINVAGLGSLVAAPVYYHYSLPPSPGLVFEINQKSYSQVEHVSAAEDIDFQADDQNIWVHWTGFAHPHEELTYKIGLGTKPDEYDIVPLQPASSPHHYFSGLHLENFQKYYVTVEAENKVGTVNVSSDGVLILPANPVELNFKVIDGILCGEGPQLSCPADSEFSSDPSSVHAHWEIPENISHYFTHVEWAIERFETSLNRWVKIRDFENMHAFSSGRAIGLQLHNNDHIRTVAKFCHPDGCYQPVSSNGYYVLTLPLLPEEFDVLHVKDNMLTARWKPWTQPGLESLDTFNHYEWSVVAIDGGLLVPWKPIKHHEYHLDDNQIVWEIKFDVKDCAKIGIRGFNKAALDSTIYANLPECYRKKDSSNFVLDATGDWDDQEKTLGKVAYDPAKGWLEPDVDYTPSNNMISAVWPQLRHGNFKWKIISDKAIRDWKQATGSSDAPLTFETYHDRAPEVLSVGYTRDRFINVENLQLIHGQRYYVCVHADASRITYNHIDEILEAVSNCSDGVIVDLTPPLPNKDSDLYLKNKYQSSTSEFVINWAPFVDIEEEYGTIPHLTGIKSYHYGLGSFPGKTDVVPFTLAGFSYYIHLHGLELQGGQRYYDVIKATDFAGHETIVHSTGVIVDVTPPLITDSKIIIYGLGRSSYQTTKTISASWRNVFVDPESDIASYEWCVGTKPKYCDVMAFQPTDIAEGSYDSNLNVFDGQTYYVSVKAYNNAFLSTITSSWSIIVDTSPPTCGIVYDGKKGGIPIDINYKVDVNSLNANWKGFNDPHTPLVGYFVGVGTCPNCHNFLEYTDLGLNDEISWTGLKLALGQKYYITVKACNAAGLCCITSSDGVISDNTPPNVGLVYDGLEDEDLHWQYSRHFISAHWLDFHDVHSGLSHYEWRAGTTPGGNDIFKKKILLLDQSAFIVHLDKPMPVSYYIHITVRAYNKVGLYSEASSNGFRIDVTPPTIRIPVEFDTKQSGAIYQSIQYWRSGLKIQWHFVDMESPIYKQYLSVFTHQNSYLSFPTLTLPGSYREYQFSNLELHDGDRYIIRVIACNHAQLCNYTDTQEMRIDGSPPNPGVFALATDRANPLPYEIKDWMLYIGGYGIQSQLKLAWLSFSDPHSEIMFYLISVGSVMYATDIHNSGLQPMEDEALKTEDGFYIQTTHIHLKKPIVTGDIIYVTIWAQNRAGLNSAPLHGSFQFDDVPGSNYSPLKLVRDCVAQSCKGHCACAGASHLCPYLEQTCNDVTGQPGYPDINVIDIFNTGVQSESRDIDFTTATCTLAARWSYNKDEPGVKHPDHYDYTVGVDSEAPGSAFSSSDQIWFDNLWLDSVVITPLRNPGQKNFLEPNRLYKFYVRAWFDKNTFAVYSSNGVKSDSTPPEISKLGRIRELSQKNMAHGLDILTSSDQISWSWTNSFKDDQSAIYVYRITLSSFPGGEDIMHSQGNPQDHVTLTKLNDLLAGVKYYMNVIAVNRAQLLSMTLTSNGFIIDKEPPVTGSVIDGIGLIDISYQNSSHVVAASWHGFFDLHTYIHHYEWCVGSAHGSTDILPCTTVGLKQSSSQYIPGKTITRYFSSVYAIDGAGHKSNAAHSDGVIVDLTPPQSTTTFQFGSNLLQNPSFEQFTNGVPNNWQVTGKANKLMSVNTPYLDIKGQISQRIRTEPNEYYCITIYLAHPLGQKVESLGQITVPGLQKIFSLREKMGSINFKADDEVEWSPQVFYFVASESVSTISVESVGLTSSLLINSISVQHIGPLAARDAENTVHANLIIGNRYHAVYCHWKIIDPESGIKEFLWAIGTVKGGTQIQGFKSVGTSTYAFNDFLILSHKSSVYVTVVAENNAGLKTVKYSTPLKVHLTPPEICCVTIGDDKNNHYQKSLMIRVGWQVMDKEADIAKCQLAFGTKDNYQDIQRLTDVGTSSPISAKLPTATQHGTEIYATIRCESSTGLSSKSISQAVIMMISAPRSHNALVTVGINSLTPYPQLTNHQPYTDSLDISWSGFSDVQGIQNYEVRVSDKSGRDIVPWISTKMPWITSIKLKDLHLVSGQAYQIFVRAINYAGLPSDVASTMVTIDTDNPQVQAGTFRSRWLGRDLELSWPRKFFSHSSLVYEVCIGSHPSGNDILRWTETKDTQLKIQNIKQAREYHVVITAINEAGLFSTESQVILR